MQIIKDNLWNILILVFIIRQLTLKYTDISTGNDTSIWGKSSSLLHYYYSS